jgi:hypothetical protein
LWAAVRTRTQRQVRFSARPIKSLTLGAFYTTVHRFRLPRG